MVRRSLVRPPSLAGRDGPHSGHLMKSVLVMCILFALLSSCVQFDLLSAKNAALRAVTPDEAFVAVEVVRRALGAVLR